MEIIIEKMGTAENTEQKVNSSVYKQQKNSLEGVAERKEMKMQHDAKKQPVSYDAVSLHGDTLSISKVGKTAGSQKESGLVNEDTADGIVIRKKADAKKQESESSTINLFVYTESELKQMYLDGDITRAEYDEEVNSREMQG